MMIIVTTMMTMTMLTRGCEDSSYSEVKVMVKEKHSKNKKKIIKKYINKKKKFKNRPKIKYIYLSIIMMIIIIIIDDDEGL